MYIYIYTYEIFPIIVFFDHSYVICFFPQDIRIIKADAWTRSAEARITKLAKETPGWNVAGKFYPGRPWDKPWEDHRTRNGELPSRNMGKYGEKSSPKKWQSNLWAEYLGWVPQKKINKSMWFKVGVLSHQTSIKHSEKKGTLATRGIPTARF